MVTDRKGVVTDRKLQLQTVSHVAGAGSTVIPASPFQGLRSVRRTVTLINTSTVTNYARFRNILSICIKLLLPLKENCPYINLCLYYL
jgi:hypothetical protein